VLAVGQTVGGLKMSMEIMTVQNVRGYLDEHDTAWLNAEDVARGLGFVDYQEKDSATSGRKTYEVIRWARVNKYLHEFGFIPTSGDDVKAGDFIPENIFYRLAMKAKNAAAEQFQAKVADEILPSIRKNGVYATSGFLSRSIADPAWAIGILTELKLKQEETALLKVQLAEAKPKIDYCDSILQCADLVSTSQIAKDYGMSGKTFNKLLHKFGVEYRQGEIWLLYQKYAGLGWTQTKTQIFKGKDGREHCRVHTYWTQKGRLGLYNLLKRKGYLPLIEQAA